MPHRTVKVMDSFALFSTMSLTTILQLAKIYSRSVPPTRSSLKIETLSVQQQEGTLDCGLFAIANAVEVCHGNNPENVRYDQKKMRSHLLECFYRRVLRPFPRGSSESLPRPTHRLQRIKLYCICRMPEEYGAKMICCDTCKSWYHYSCVNLQQAENPVYWECCVCRQP